MAGEEGGQVLQARGGGEVRLGELAFHLPGVFLVRRGLLGMAERDGAAGERGQGRPGDLAAGARFHSREARGRGGAARAFHPHLERLRERNQRRTKNASYFV